MFSQQDPREEDELELSIWLIFKCPCGSASSSLDLNKAIWTLSKCTGQLGSLIAGQGRGQRHKSRGLEAWEPRVRKCDPGDLKHPPPPSLAAPPALGAHRSSEGDDGQLRALSGLHQPPNVGFADPATPAAGVGLGGRSGRSWKFARPRPRVRRPSASLRPAAGPGGAGAGGVQPRPGVEEWGAPGAGELP